MEEDNIVTTVTSAIWSPDNQEEVARLLRCGYRVASWVADKKVPNRWVAIMERDYYDP